MHIGRNGDTVMVQNLERALNICITCPGAQVYFQKSLAFCVAWDFVYGASLVAHTTMFLSGDFMIYLGELARKHRIIAALGNHDTKLADWPTNIQRFGFRLSLFDASGRKRRFRFSLSGSWDAWFQTHNRSSIRINSWSNCFILSIPILAHLFILCHDPDEGFFENGVSKRSQL